MGLYAVGHDYVAASDYGVVACRLREDGVVDACRVLLAFDQHERSAVAAESHDVGTLRRTVDIDRVLLDQRLRRKPAAVDHVCCHMPPDPLLGRQHDPLPAQLVEYERPPGRVASCAQPYRWQVEFRHPVHLGME